MSDELERVARAIAASDQEDYMEDAFVYDRRARAAIDAISEPSDAMLTAAVRVIAEEYGVCSEYVARSLAADVFRAMMRHTLGDRK